MNTSPLLETQQSLSPTLVLAPAVGDTWMLPAEYAPGAAKAEYAAVCRPGGVGMIDRSSRAVLRLTGSDRQSFLQGMVSNDVAALAPGIGCRAAFLDTTGHVLALLGVHNTGDALLIETDQGAAPRFVQTLDTYLIMEDVQIHDVSREWVILALRGEGAWNALRALSAVPFPAVLSPLAGVELTLTGGVSALAIGAVPEDAPGADLWLPAEAAPGVWEALHRLGVVPVGDGAADVLRVEAGTGTWGREITEAVLLPELDAPEIVSYTKGCYVGQEIVARMRARGHANRLLRGVLLAPNAPVPPIGSIVHAPEGSSEPGREIGRLTSVVTSPRFRGRALALAFIRREYAEDATPVAVHIPQPGGLMFAFDAQVLTPPFAGSPATVSTTSP